LLTPTGKPGFGKTVLSTTIIDDIKKTISANEDLRRVGTSMCFHHFSRLDETTRSDSAAHRALVLQLVQSHCREPRAIDVLSIFHEEKARNQARASTDDLEEVLHILLWQFPTFVVVDGIEEAYEAAGYLEQFFLKLQDVDSKAIFLSRPTVNVPTPWLGRSRATSCVVKLNADDNRKDFEGFFDVELWRMVSNGLFTQRQGAISSLVPSLCRRANGMFLWARLLVRYLHSPALSPQRRMMVLENANLLEGLEGLYGGILALLAEGYDHNQTMVVSIFRWIHCAISPLTLRTLQIALAIVPGRRTDDANYLCNWPDCVPKMTEGLVEVYHDRL
jgi:hypothetical protein